MINLVRSARRTAASMRERLSADFWALLLDLESRLRESAGEILSEAGVLQQVERALQILAALSGLAQENMNRGAGWRFLDLRRGGSSAASMPVGSPERLPTTTRPSTIWICCSHSADSQITYRCPLSGGAGLIPARDMVMLDPFNTRSLAFQVFTIRDHLAALPSLLDDGMLEAPNRILLPLATEVETEDAARLDAERVLAFELALMSLSDAIAERYFLQGANAAPTAKLAALA